MRRVNKQAICRLRRGLLALALLLASGGAAARAQQLPEEPLLHQPAPALERADLDGHPLSLAALRGKVVLVNFWATWCAPCQIEIPRFIGWQSRYGAQGLQIVGLSMDDEAAAARALAKKRHINYPVAMGDEKLGEDFGGILGLPLSMLVGRDGKIAAIYRGETDLDTMEKDVQRLLGER